MSNELKEDFLSVDPPIPGQKFVCLSFVSPEKVLEDKHLYYMWHYERHLQSKIEELNGKLKEALNGEDTGVEINKTEPCSFKQFKELFYDIVNFEVDGSSPIGTGPMLDRFVRDGGLRESIHLVIDNWVKMFRATY